jgi:hypothetical protein
MDALVTELDLQRVIVTNENWNERNSEINRLSGLQDYVVQRGPEPVLRHYITNSPRSIWASQYFAKHYG